MAPAGYYKARAIGISIIMFGILSLFTALFFDASGGAASSFELSGAGEIGPIEVTEDNTVLQVLVRLPVRQIQDTYGYGDAPNGWAVVTGELLSANKDTLFSFSDELWAESGYDEGHWTEIKNNYDLKLTVPAKGTYYMYMDIESKDLELGTLGVRVDRMVGSTVPHFAAGFLGLLLGLLVFLVSRSQIAAHGG